MCNREMYRLFLAYPAMEAEGIEDISQHNEQPSCN